jgi:hypothetical protein
MVMEDKVQTIFELPDEAGDIVFSDNEVYIDIDYGLTTAELNFNDLKKVVDAHSEKLKNHNKHNEFRNFIQSVKRKFE